MKLNADVSTRFVSRKLPFILASLFELGVNHKKPHPAPTSEIVRTGSRILAPFRSYNRSSIKNRDAGNWFSRNRSQVGQPSETLFTNEGMTARWARKRRLWVRKMQREKERKNAWRMDSPVAFWASSCRLVAVRSRRKPSSTVAVALAVIVISSMWIDATRTWARKIGQRIAVVCTYTNRPYDSATRGRHERCARMRNAIFALFPPRSSSHISFHFHFFSRINEMFTVFIYVDFELWERKIRKRWRKRWTYRIKLTTE